MTLNVGYKPNVFQGNGVIKEFAYDFNPISIQYLKVYFEEEGKWVEQTSGWTATIYSLSNYDLENMNIETLPESERFSSYGGLVTFDEPPTTRVQIARVINEEQPTSFKTSSGFDAKVVETSLDKLTGMIQQLQEASDRSVKVEVGDNQTPEELLEEVYEKLDSATEIAEDAIKAANQAQIAADNATQAVESAEETLREVTAYVDSAKIEINNTKETAIEEVDTKVTTAKADINSTVVMAQSDITFTKDTAIGAVESAVADLGNTVTQAKTDINSTVTQAKTDITFTKDTAIQIVNDALDGLDKTIGDAEGEINRVKLETISTVNNTKDNAINTVTEIRDGAIVTISNTVANAQEEIERVREEGTTDITNTVEQGKSDIQGYIAESETEIRQIAREEVQDYTDTTIKPSLQIYVDNSENNAQIATEKANIATSKANECLESANASANSAISANNSAEQAEEALKSITGVYRVKGSVATYNNLPSVGQKVGDVYNVLDSGANYVWTDNGWDKLSETVDLSNYALKTELPTLARANVPGLVAGGNWLTVNQSTGKMECGELTKAQYDSALGYTFIGKTTLENVLTGKGYALDSNTVHKIGNEEIGGNKTFTARYVDSKNTAYTSGTGFEIIDSATNSVSIFEQYRTDVGADNETYWTIINHRNTNGANGYFGITSKKVILKQLQDLVL